MSSTTIQDGSHAKTPGAPHAGSSRDGFGHTWEGTFQVGAEERVAILASRFNEFIVSRLVEGARDALRRHGAEPHQVELVWVPGAWELPVVCNRLAHSGRFSSIIAVGAVIRGATPHFDVVVDGATRGLAQCASLSGIPVLLGLLTTDTIEQAVERAGTKAGNKGFEAAMSAIEIMNLMRVLPVGR